MNFFKNLFLVILLTLTLTVTPLLTGISLATQIDPIKAPVFTDVSLDVKENLSAEVLNSERFKNLKYDFNLDKIHVKQFPKEYGEMKVVYVPIKDNTGYSYSNYIEFFDINGKFQNHLLFAFSKNDNNVYHTTMQTEGANAEFDISESGELIRGSASDANNVGIDLNKIFQETQKTDNNKISVIKTGFLSLFSIKTANASTYFWPCMGACLSSLGVPSWLITAVAIVCAVICVGTAGLACAACISAAAAGAATEFSYCFGQCWEYPLW